LIGSTIEDLPPQQRRNLHLHFLHLFISAFQYFSFSAFTLSISAFQHFRFSAFTMLNFLTTPVPHEEAIRSIANKPALLREQFALLPDEMKARAFTITGIEDYDVLQAVRDEIASLPAGADWNKVKKAVMEKISPWFTERGAAARAETLMSHHAFAAYSSAQTRIMDRMIDVFPYRQYLSTKDGKVRASHAALHGIILPADHPFWTYHTPPWEWNCRCQVVELTEEDRDEELANDDQRPPESRRVLQGTALKQLDQGSLNRGLSTNVDVRTPKERGGNYQWSARDTTLPYAEIKTRWDAQTLADFEGWAGKQNLEDGRSLLDWLGGIKATEAVISHPMAIALPAAIQKQVSLALNVTAHNAEEIKAAIDLVDSVHSDGVLPRIPVTDNPGSGTALGSYSYQGDGTAVRIAVRPKGLWPRMTTAHELGHFIDHQAFGTTGFASMQAGPVKDIVAKIKKTATFKRITQEAGTPKARKYFKDPTEVWARAYAQFIAIESGDPKILKELNLIRSGPQPWRQWPDDEFEPIRELIKKHFITLLWMPPTKP
jgi:SPP1 gp7 family putative phage head morphogenesis protein